MKCKQFVSLPLLAFFLTLAPMALASNTWYVDGVNGSDSNNCMSSLTACKTIGRAISLASSGDSIMVAAATYAENLYITFSLNMIGSGASTTIIDGQGTRGTVMSVSSVNAQVTLSNVTIRNGGLATYGGGIDNSGTLAINNSVVSGNLAGGLRGQRGHGGGIYNSGRLTVTDTTISGNRAVCGNYCSGQGGGIFNDSSGSVTINNSSVTGNLVSATAAFAIGGGGIYNSGRVTINNNTISGNSTTALGQGGGVYNSTSGGMTINNSTISGNKAGYKGKGDNVYNVGAVVMQNSIVANGVNGNCYGSVTSIGYNLSSDGTCNFNDTGDRNNTDPKLGTLGYYGGPTQTMPLLSGSPAIDAGNPTGCTDGQGHLLKTDQRGLPRPDKEDASGCDMGAYESQSD